MERRNFFKKIAGVITGLVIAPFVIKAEEAPQINEWVNDIPDGWLIDVHKDANLLQHIDYDVCKSHYVIFHSQYGAINYKIGDKIAGEHNPDKVLGTCTGFTHDNSCIEIDSKCWGGKSYFMKA